METEEAINLIRDIRARVIEILERFLQQEFGNRLSAFTIRGLGDEIMDVLKSSEQSIKQAIPERSETYHGLGNMGRAGEEEPKGSAGAS